MIFKHQIVKHSFKRLKQHHTLYVFSFPMFDGCRYGS